MSYSAFLPEVRLLIRVLPLVAEEKSFALKGGTAINMFIRNMPRLSVDIDLCYLPIEPREKSLLGISKALDRIRQRIKTTIPSAKVKEVIPKGVGSASGLVVSNEEAQIKIEVNLVIRGSAFPNIEMELCERAKSEFESDVTMQLLSVADIYGGKLCAALDRQHPRDLFDVKLLLEGEGITDDVRRAFVIYLSSHDRPMNELLAPTWKDITKTFEDDFKGMTLEEVSLSSLLETRGTLLNTLLTTLRTEEKEFLLSLKRAEPKWNLLGFTDLATMPALRWKLLNIQRMDKAKHKEALSKLEKILAG